MRESRSVRGKVPIVGENQGFEGELIHVRLVNKGRAEMRGRESSDVGFTSRWIGPGSALSVLRLKGEQINANHTENKGLSTGGRVHSSKAIQCTFKFVHLYSIMAAQ